MKPYIYLFLALAFLSTELFAQCRPMTEQEFAIARRRLSMNQGGLNTYQSALDIARVNCLTSNQAKDLAAYLMTDRDKIDFLKLSYQNLVDRENFTDAMDVFRLMSSAMRLYHQTMGAGGQPTNPSFPTNGQCMAPMNNMNFQSLMSRMQSSQNDRANAAQILNLAQSDCYSVQQLRAIAPYLRDENIRLDVLKRVYASVYDIQNYPSLSNLFSASLSRQFITFCQNPQGQPTNSNNNWTSCDMNEADFNTFVQSVETLSFDKDQVSHIKTHLSARCLTPSQIKRLMGLIKFDESKLEIAKAMYTNCTDKPNYYQVSETFTFDSSKSALNEFIRTR